MCGEPGLVASSHSHSAPPGIFGPGPPSRLQPLCCYHPLRGLKAHKIQLGRYSVSVITTMEITLFGTALVVLVIGLIAMLLSR